MAESVDYKKKYESLKREFHVLNENYNNLHDNEYKKRPFKCKGYADTFNYEQAHLFAKWINRKIKGGNHVIVCECKIEGELIEVRLIGFGDIHVEVDGDGDNFSWYGIVDSLTSDKCSVNLNDIIGVSACDIIDYHQRLRQVKEKCWQTES